MLDRRHGHKSSHDPGRRGCRRGPWPAPGRCLVDVNLQGLLNITHAAPPHLREAAGTGPRNVADIVNISSVAGRVTGPMTGVYNLTEHGVAALSDAFRKEFAGDLLRVSSVEPGAVQTELTNHIRDGVREQARQRFADMAQLESEDMSDAIRYVVTRRRTVAINEVLIRPTEQAH